MSQLSFKTEYLLCCSFLITCKVSRNDFNPAQVSALSHVSLASMVCDGSVDSEGSVDALKSPGKVGSGRARGLNQVVLHCMPEQLPLGRWFTAASKISLLKGLFTCAVTLPAGKRDGQL